MESFNVFDMWSRMGVVGRVVVAVLFGLSIYSIWIMLERTLAFRRARISSRLFLRTLERELSAHDVSAALSAARRHPESPVAKVVAAILAEYQLSERTLVASSAGELDLDFVEALEREIVRGKDNELAHLRRGLGGLSSVASAAPFIGLFGTVVGIINAFQSMAKSGQSGLGAVSAGISEALVTTAGGLVVAIPSVVIVNYLSGRIEDFALAMNDISSQLLNHLVREAKSQKRAA